MTVKIFASNELLRFVYHSSSLVSVYQTSSSIVYVFTLPVY